MLNLFLENGLLNKAGEKYTSGVRGAIQEIMESDEIRDMNEAELRALQSNLAKMVGDHFGKLIARNMQFVNQLNAMTDEQFYAHLKEKYGDTWILNSLEKEERDRIPAADLQRLADEYHSVGELIRERMVKHGVRFK